MSKLHWFLAFVCAANLGITLYRLTMGDGYYSLSWWFSDVTAVAALAWLWFDQRHTL